MPAPTAGQRHKLNRDPVTDPHIVLLEFREDGQTAIERAAVNTEDVTHLGNVYTRAAIDVRFPQTADGDTAAQLVMSNIDRVIGRALSAATQRIRVRLILIDVSAPDIAIIDTSDLMAIMSASGNSLEISATLGPRASFDEPLNQRTTRAFFPGVFLAGR